MSPIKRGVKYIKNYVANEKRGLFLAGVALFAVVIVFTFYLKKVGIPMTSANNKYNFAVQLNTAKNYPKAKVVLEESLQTWWTPEAENLLKEVNQHNQGL